MPSRNRSRRTRRVHVNKQLLAQTTRRLCPVFSGPVSVIPFCFRRSFHVFNVSFTFPMFFTISFVSFLFHCHSDPYFSHSFVHPCPLAGPTLARSLVYTPTTRLAMPTRSCVSHAIPTPHQVDKTQTSYSWRRGLELNSDELSIMTGYGSPLPRHDRNESLHPSSCSKISTRQLCHADVALHASNLVSPPLLP